MIKFLHFSDIHLGVENYGYYDAKTGLHSRFKDFIQSLTTTIDIALEDEVDFALFCGDAYKNNNPTPTHQREFARQIHRLSQANIPTVLINGNHDNPLAFGRASTLDIFQTLCIPNIHVFIKPGLIRLPTKHGTVQVIGVPWPTKNQYLEKDEYRDSNTDSMNKKIQRRLMDTIKSLEGKLSNKYPKIMAAHLTVAEAVYSGSENYAYIGNDPVIPVQFFSGSAFDYIALGHIHRYQNLNPSGKPPVVYSGSLDRIHFGEEKEDKGFCIGTICDDGKVEYEFIFLPSRKMVTIEINIKDERNPTQDLLTEIAKYHLKDAIVRIHYDVSEEQEKKIDFKKMDEALKDAFLIAGITKNIQRKSQLARRSTLSEEMDLMSALEEYIRLQNWQSQEKELKKMTSELQQEFNRFNESGGGKRG